MIIAITISAIIVAFLPMLFLKPEKQKALKVQQPAGPQPDIETVAYRLLTDRKQQQPVPEQFVRPVLACGNSAITIVDERAEFGGNNQWVHASALAIRNTGTWADILKRPACAN